MILRINIGAFVLSPELGSLVESIKGDRLFLRSNMSVHEGGSKGAIEYLGTNSTPDLLIIETTAQDDALFEELGALADVCAPGTRVIIVGTENDVNLFKTLIDQGISQYFVGIPNEDELKSAISDAFVDKQQSEKCKVVAVAGIRGGVGSSVIAHNIATEIADLTKDDVIIVDLDINYGTGALNFNIQPQNTIVDALAQAGSLDEVLLNRFLEKCTENVSLLASPGSLGTGMEISALNLEPLINMVKQMASYVVLDLPHVWNNWVQDVLVDADETILVGTPDLYNLRDGKNIIEFLSPHRGADAPIRVVLNRQGQIKKGEIKDKEFREVFALPPSASIPYDPDTFSVAMSNGEPINAKSKAASVIRELAGTVSGKSIKESGKGIGKAKDKGGFLSSLLKKK